MCEGLQETFTISVITSDRDLGSSASYPHIPTGKWHPHNAGTRVYYCTSGEQNFVFLLKLIEEVAPDVIYLNGMFSRVFTIYPLLLLYLGKITCRVVLAPRGMLRASALQFKPWKKQLFLWLFQRAGLARRLVFHATDKDETAAVTAVFSRGSVPFHIVEIPNFPMLPAAGISDTIVLPEQPSFLFIGRVHPIKGLLLALQALAGIQGPVYFTIVGPMEDPKYWQKCKEVIDSLPPHLTVTYLGERSPAEVKQLLRAHSFLLLPTFGENFGHAIFEAFALGRPVIISDQTPWRDLQDKGIGWDISLSDPLALCRAIRTAISLDTADYQQMSQNAYQFAIDFIEKSELKERYIKLFLNTQVTSYA